MFSNTRLNLPSLLTISIPQTCMGGELKEQSKLSREHNTSVELVGRYILIMEKKLMFENGVITLVGQ